MSPQAWFRRLVENLLPWYDVVAERERRARSARIVSELKTATTRAEATRKAYEAMAHRIDTSRR